MTQNKTNKVSNVPPLRFPEFSGEWEKCKLGEIMLYSKDRVPVSTLTDDNYVSTENMLPQFGGIYRAPNVPSNGSAIAYQKGDTLLSNIRPYLKKVWLANNNGGCSADVFVLKSINVKCNSAFLYYLIANDNFISHVMSGAKGVKMPRGDKEQIKKYQLSIPSKKEQGKITELLSILDQRISTQIRVIEDLQTLKKAISTKVFTEIKGCNSEKLGTLCSITTGKLDANAMTDEGEYMFFTCSRENYKTDTFAFDGEALLIAGNGEIGSVKYYNGKFNAYQRTYVLQNFSENIKYLQYYIEHHLPQRVLKEKNVGAMPYIVLSTLADMPILLPSENKQNNIAKALQVIENKIYVEYSVLDQYKQQKQYLLQKMFI